MKTGDIVELDRDILRLEKQLSGMYQKRVSLLESEMKSSRERVETLGSSVDQPATRRAASPAAKTSKVATKARKAPAAGKKKRAAKKRKRMSTEEVEKRLVAVVKAAGAKGLSQKAISDAAGVNYQTTAKKLKEMKSTFVKKGSLKDARYTLKG